METKSSGVVNIMYSFCPSSSAGVETLLARKDDKWNLTRLGMDSPQKDHLELPKHRVSRKERQLKLVSSRSCACYSDYAEA